MKIQAIKTGKVLAGVNDIVTLLDGAITTLDESSIVAITSKIISLCENRVVPIGSVDKETLVKRESDYYLPGTAGKYGYHFTITNNTLIAMAGIDESNGNNNYVLWPKDAQKSANKIRRYLVRRFKLKNVGVVVVDSTSQPSRLGTTGIAIAYSGFLGLTNYVGSPDLFGKPFGVTQASIAGGLAAAAVLIMGEGTEQTPLCVINDVGFIKFQARDPSTAELASLNIPLEDDLYAPFINSVAWKQGERSTDRKSQ